MSLLSRFVSVFRRERLNREIDEEQEFHLASLTDELIEAGMTPTDAARQARIQFGNRARTKAESRDVRLLAWLDTTGQDLYYGFRTLRKSPGFAAVAILTLAIGIGANTAIFSVVNGVLLNALPFHKSDQIVSLFEEIPNFKKGSIPYPNFLDWQHMNRTFSAMAGYRSTDFNVSGKGEPEHLHGEMISAEFFDILGVNPLIGRNFTASDDHLGAAPTAMISETLWKRKFNAAANIVGQRIAVDDVGRTVIGVVRDRFHLRLTNFQEDGTRNEIYVPIGEWNEPRFHNDRGSAWGMDAIGRLKPGVTFEQARDDMNRVSRQLAAMYPDINNNKKINMAPIKEEIVGDVRPVLLILLGAVGFVLLIACVNVTNLLLARSTSRQREFAIRMAIGAGQGRVVRQLLTESILLGAIGGGLGLLLAKIGMAGAIAAMPQTLPRAEEIGLDSRVLFFTLAVSVLAGILFGLAPTFRMQRANIAGDLKENSRAVARTRSHVQGAFVVAEMALALVLLVGAGLMIRTLFVLWTTDPGFNARNVLTFSVSTPTTLRSEPPAAIRAFFRQMHHTLASTPEIESTALSWGASPMEGDAESYFWFAGRPKPAHHTELPMALRYIVEPSYLKTLQIPLEQGRFLNDSDNERSEHVVVVDQSLAEKHFPLRNPIGQYLELAGNPIKIVGIASHVNQWGLGSDAARPLHAQIYLPLDQIPNKYMNFFAQNVRVYVRGKRDLPNFETLRARLLAMNSGFITYNDQPMERIVLATVAGKRFTMALLAVFAGIALVLASIGIYGVLSYLVGQRTQEIGVRMALGAARWDVMRMILTDGARLAAAGIAIGVVAALGLTHLMTSLLFGVKPTDVLTFVLVSCTLAVIALLACYLPARRAMQIDPMTALRNE